MKSTIIDRPGRELTRGRGSTRGRGKPRPAPLFLNTQVDVSEDVLARGRRLNDLINPGPEPLVFWYPSPIAGKVYWINLETNFCTCPARGVCKHIVGAAIKWLKENS